MQRFSDHFAIGRSQIELDFVDIPLQKDLRLFVDPYALSVETGDWFVQANDLVVDFFQLVIDAIRQGDSESARSLLAHLREPNDTHLGMSKGRPRGRGVGHIQADQLFQRLRQSRAVHTGHLRDLADAELVIPGISNDKISDITINIIRRTLIDYTQGQCRLHNIPMSEVASGMYWESGSRHWRNSYEELPVHDGGRILLVPKAAVRYRMMVDHQRYYRHFVLEFLQSEHLEAGTALVRTLKNGRRVVSKTDLEDIYPIDKEFLHRFSEEHPEVLEAYKDSLPKYAEPMTNEAIEQKQPVPRDVTARALIAQLDSIPPGNHAASRFHEWAIGALEAIFYPSLTDPTKEQEINAGRKRIDIRFSNRAEKGFFLDLGTKARISCAFILCECKNYSDDIGNPEIDQLLGRFSDSRGRFGLMICRSLRNRDAAIKRCRDGVHSRQGYVIILEDSDLVTLLMMRECADDHGINHFLSERYAEIVM